MPSFLRRAGDFDRRGPPVWNFALATAITALGGVFWLMCDHDWRAEAANEPWLGSRSEEVVMTTRKLEKAEWRPFFDAVSKLLEAKVAEVEVASLDLGDQVQAEWLPLLGITYDPNDDIVEIALEGLDHMIYKPREIYLENGGGGLASVEIVDADGVRQIVKLKDELLLPPPR